MKSIKEIQTYQSKLKRKPSLEEYGVIEEDSSSDENQVSVSNYFLTKSQNTSAKLTFAFSWISWIIMHEIQTEDFTSTLCIRMDYNPT